jgi:hypothetical protein
LPCKKEALLADQQRCGKWMPRAKEYCARRPLHEDDCRTAAAMADNRARKTERRVGQTDPPPGAGGTRRTSCLATA